MDGSMRISDADRESAVRLLGEQFAQGRLDKDEFDERSDAAWSARTWADLDPLFVDLPVRSPRVPEPVRPRGPAVPSRRAGTRFPLMPLLAVLVVVLVLTKMPVLLLVCLVWFAVSLLGRSSGGGRWGRGC